MNPTEQTIYPKNSTYKIIVNSTHIHIYDLSKGKLMRTIDNYEELLICENSQSVLIKINDTEHIFVGRIAYCFEIDDEITELKTSTDNNDEIHIYATGLENTYLLNDHIYIENDKLIMDDPYEQYWGLSKRFSILRKYFRKYEIETI